MSETVAESVPETEAVPVSETEPEAATVPVPEPETESVPVPVSEPVSETAQTTVIAIAVDLHGPSATELGWIAGMTQALVDRVDGIDLVHLQNRGDGPDLRPSSPDAVARLVEGVDLSASGELSRLILDVATSLRGYDGRVGLVVITDGLGPRRKSVWRQALDAAGEAGVPILVGGIWSDGFEPGLRKDLRKLADLTGGQVFYVQGSEQVDDLLDRFEDAITGDGTHSPEG
jgi:hypothetical protein